MRSVIAVYEGFQEDNDSVDEGWKDISVGKIGPYEEKGEKGLENRREQHSLPAKGGFPYKEGKGYKGKKRG